MTRQGIVPNPEIRLFEAYTSFAGGHNSEISNDRLKDEEFVTLQNIDLSGRDSAKRRSGRKKLASFPTTEFTQGHFIYYLPDSDKVYTHVIAKNGYLFYYDTTDPNNYTEIRIPIDGNPVYNFQRTRPVEAVQYGTSLYVATGSGMVEVTMIEGEGFIVTATSVVPYVPTVQEAIYIGTNGLADNPGSYVQDGVSTDLQVAGVVPNKRSGAVNLDAGFTAYLNKPADVTSVEYKWEYRKTGTTAVTGAVTELNSLVITAACTTNGMVALTLDGIVYLIPVDVTMTTPTLVASAIRNFTYYGWLAGGVGDNVTFLAVEPGVKLDAIYNPSGTGAAGTMTTTVQGITGTTWTLGRNWTADTAGKTYNLHVDTAGNYDIQASVRETGTDSPLLTFSENISGYVIGAILSKTNNEYDSTHINTCNRIRLHWDRILLFGDTQNPFLMYISDLQAPKYFPTNMILSFDTGKLEAINSIVRFQDYLVVMTNTTIQTLIGKDPSTYARFLIHDTIGCVCPNSAMVVGNQIIFLSYSGVTALRPNPYRIEAMAVNRVDAQIHTEIMNLLFDIDIPIPTPETITTNIQYAVLPHITPDMEIVTNPCALFYDNQYWLCFPNKNLIYRFYHERNVWVRDASTKLTATHMISHGGHAYELGNGAFYVHDNSIWSDDSESYIMVIDSKMYDLGAAFNNKKLRRMYLIARHVRTDTNLYVKVMADSHIIISPETGQAVVINGGEDTIWQTTTQPNLHYYAGTFLNAWILGLNPLGDIQLSVQRLALQGKCRRVKTTIWHMEDRQCEIYGFGIEFKMKKV